MQHALITGGSRGLGCALATELVDRDWNVIITGRDPVELNRVTTSLGRWATAVAGDVTDAGHRAELTDLVGSTLDLLINNASYLGPSPLQRLEEIRAAELARLMDVNVVAPLALIGSLLPAISASHGAIVNVSSDAAVEAYPTWGPYGASKAALDHATAALIAEHPDLDIYAFDPGDMRTDMHQAAFPGEDISDRPEPDVAARALLRLLDARPPSGRYSSDALVEAA